MDLYGEVIDITKDNLGVFTCYVKYNLNGKCYLSPAYLSRDYCSFFIGEKVKIFIDTISNCITSITPI